MKKVFLTLTMALFFVAFSNAQSNDVAITVKEDVKTEATITKVHTKDKAATCAGKEKAHCAGKSSKATCANDKKAKATEEKKDN
jgi:hypothetical protein